MAICTRRKNHFSLELRFFKISRYFSLSASIQIYHYLYKNEPFVNTRQKTAQARLTSMKVAFNFMDMATEICFPKIVHYKLSRIKAAFLVGLDFLLLGLTFPLLQAQITSSLAHFFSSSSSLLQFFKLTFSSSGSMHGLMCKLEGQEQVI